jgi:hypothetical protein
MEVLCCCWHRDNVLPAVTARLLDWWRSSLRYLIWILLILPDLVWIGLLLLTEDGVVSCPNEPFRGWPSWSCYVLLNVLERAWRCPYSGCCSRCGERSTLIAMGPKLL